MSMISFKKGLLANLPATKTAGTFYVTTDERAMYLDVDASTRIRLGDFQEFATVEALTANPNPSTTALYYVSGINCLAKWNGTEYIQINKDTGMTSIEVAGDGNAITAAVYDATGRKLTLTKGATYMTAADVDGKISDKVGTLKIGDAAYDTVTEFVNKKAEETLAAAQSGSSETAASVKVALDNYKTENDARVQANANTIEAIQNDYLKTSDKEALQANIDAKADQTDLTALSNKVGTVADGKTVVGLISDAQAQADKGVADAAAAMDAADAAQADVDALEGKVGTVPADKTVVQMIADAQGAATYDDSEVRSLISANATAIQAHKDAIDAKVTTLIGEDADKSVRTIASEETAKIVAGADTSFDTLKEIADWISSHKTDAAAMNSAIVTLEGILDGIGGEGEKATVVAYVTDAITALKISDYAKAADLTALAARVNTLEGQVTTINGDATTTGSIAKAAADTLASAKTYADQSEADAVATAKDYTDELANGQVKTNTEAIATKAAQTDLDAAVTRIGNAESEIDALQEASATHATKTEVSAVQTALNEYKTSNDAAVALKANSTDVYTKTEVDAKLTGALSWGEF